MYIFMLFVSPIICTAQSFYVFCVSHRICLSSFFLWFAKQNIFSGVDCTLHIICIVLHLLSITIPCSSLCLQNICVSLSCSFSLARIFSSLLPLSSDKMCDGVEVFPLTSLFSQWSHNFLLSCVYKTIASSKWEFQKAIQASHSFPQTFSSGLWT